MPTYSAFLVADTLHLVSVRRSWSAQRRNGVSNKCGLTRLCCRQPQRRNVKNVKTSTGLKWAITSSTRTLLVSNGTGSLEWLCDVFIFPYSLLLPERLLVQQYFRLYLLHLPNNKQYIICYRLCSTLFAFQNIAYSLIMENVIIGKRIEELSDRKMAGEKTNFHASYT